MLRSLVWFTQLACADITPIEIDPDGSPVLFCASRVSTTGMRLVRLSPSGDVMMTDFAVPQAVYSAKLIGPKFTKSGALRFAAELDNGHQLGQIVGGDLQLGARQEGRVMFLLLGPDGESTYAVGMTPINAEGGTDALVERYGADINTPVWTRVYSDGEPASRAGLPVDAAVSHDGQFLYVLGWSGTLLPDGQQATRIATTDGNVSF